jgi:hypothetical protein
MGRPQRRGTPPCPQENSWPFRPQEAIDVISIAASEYLNVFSRAKNGLSGTNVVMRRFVLSKRAWCDLIVHPISAEENLKMHPGGDYLSNNHRLIAIPGLHGVIKLSEG